MNTLALVAEELSASPEDVLRKFDEDPSGATLRTLTALAQPWSDMVSSLHEKVPARGAFYAFGHQGESNSTIRLKKHLLYFDRLYIADPLERIGYPALAAARVLNGVPLTDALTARVRQGLVSLHEINPFVTNDIVMPVPIQHLGISLSIQSLASSHLNHLPLGPDPGLHARRNTELIDWLIADYLEAEVVVARDPDPLVQGIFMSGPTKQGTIIATSSERFVVPDVTLMPDKVLLELRENSSLFREWRSAYGDLVEYAYKDNEEDEAAFAREFKRGVLDKLRPIAERLERELKLPSLSDLIAGSVTTLGIGTVAYLAGVSNTGAAASTASYAIGWFARRISRRFGTRRSATRAARTCIGYLSTQAK